MMTPVLSLRSVGRHGILCSNDCLMLTSAKSTDISISDTQRLLSAVQQRFKLDTKLNPSCQYTVAAVQCCYVCVNGVCFYSKEHQSQCRDNLIPA